MSRTIRSAHLHRPSGGGIGDEPRPRRAPVSYAAPTFSDVNVHSDPSCAAVGHCGITLGLGFCDAGRVWDPCTTDADCNQPPNKCRIVANYIDQPGLALLSARLTPEKVDYLAAFQPATRKCSRKVDVTLDPSRFISKLKLKAEATVNGIRKRDSDRFKYLKR